ncbi:MAG: family hydrolase [Actinomycetia bacterium]|nr:family hydrolase [Actinomycetes bacterium]
MSANVRAVVFDFDGLVLDTETAVYHAWREAFVAHGAAPPTMEEWAAEIGSHGVVDFVALLRERATRPFDVERMHTVRRARHDELVAAERVLPGVGEWLDDADARGFGIAIASSSPYDWVHTHLDRLGIRHRFAHVSCRDENVPAKPAPDVYLRACAALGVPPADAIAVEDSPNGIAGAKAAGLRCVAVPNGITAMLDCSAADLVVESLAACSLADALSLLGVG